MFALQRSTSLASGKALQRWTPVPSSAATSPPRMFGRHDPTSLRKHLFAPARGDAPTRQTTLKASHAYLPQFDALLGLKRVAWLPIVDGVLQIGAVTIALYGFLALLAAIRSRVKELHPVPLTQQSKTVELCKIIFKAMYSPMRIFFPFMALVHATHIAISSLDRLTELCSDCTGLAKHEPTLRWMLSVVVKVDKVIWDFALVSFLALGVWFLVSLKNRYVMWLLEDKGYRDPAFQELKRVVVPFNALSSWILVGAGIMLGFHVTGIDVRPMLAFGSVSGVIVGLAAQSVVANMISGVNLFLSRPFVAGDRIEGFAANGNRVLGGVVEHVNPLRTVLRVDKGYPLEVPNKVLADLIIGNESRNMGNPEPEGGRRVVVSAKLKVIHLDKVEEIQTKITKLVGSMTGVNDMISYGATIANITENDIIINIQASSLKRIKSFASFRLSIVVEVRKLLAEMGIEDAKLVF